MTDVIRVEGLAKTFVSDWKRRRIQAVKDLSFTVREGEVCGFLGPNGAGKTTTLKMLFGLLKPTAGTISLFGSAPGTPDFRSRVGFLPENPYFYDYLSGREFLDFYGRLFGLPASERSTRAAGLLKLVGLEDAADLNLRKYSKGMLQRVGMAQALINDPALLVLDEPQSGLDPAGRKQIRDLILELRGQGKTILFSSHILSDAEMICDRVLIVDKGRLLATGRLEEMLAARAESYEIRVEGLASGDIRRIGGRAVSTIESAGQVQFLFSAADGELTEILAEIARAGGRLRSLSPVRETLEDVFLREVEGTGR